MSNLIAELTSVNGPLSQCKSIRNLFLVPLKTTFAALSILMGIMAWGVIISGAIFLDSDELSTAKLQMNEIRESLATLLFFYAIILNVVAVIGVVIS